MGDAHGRETLGREPPTPAMDRQQIVGAGEHRRQGQGQDRRQRVAPTLARPPIRQSRQHLVRPHHRAPPRDSWQPAIHINMR